MSTDPILEVRELGISYGEAQALREVYLRVDEGKIIGVIGPNGAGKTTLAEGITGHKAYASGQIRYRGEEVALRSTTWLTDHKLIYCTEKRDLFRFMSVEENLILGAYTNRDQVDERLDMAYALFPILRERKRQKADTLSGGEQQMLALARSLMADPDLLILDEPTLGLAPGIIDDISEAITNLSEDISILVCEQNVTFTLRHADRIYLLENGEIRLEGTPDEVRDNEYVREVYIGK